MFSFCRAIPACSLAIPGLVLSVDPRRDRLPPLPDDAAQAQQTYPQDRPAQSRDQRPPPHPLHRSLGRAHRSRHDRLAREEPIQFLGQSSRRAVPPPGLLLQAFQADRLQVQGHGRVELTHRHGLLPHHLDQRVHRRGRLERRPARQQAVEDRAQRVHVRRRTDLLPLRLLRRHIAGRPHHLTGVGQAAVAFELLRQAEVGHLGTSQRVEQDIRRLQIAVDHTFVVRIFDRIGHLADQLGRLAWRQRAVRDLRRQACPLHEPHAEEVLTVVLADLVDRHDAGMIEIGSGFGFQVEALDLVFARELPGQDHLERDGPVEADLPRPVYHPHAAAGDLAEQLVVAEVADASGFGWSRRARPSWILPEHRGGGLIVGGSALVARAVPWPPRRPTEAPRPGWRIGRRPRGDGRRLGDRGRIRCRLGLGSHRRAGLQGARPSPPTGEARAPGLPVRPEGRDAPRRGTSTR